MTCEEYRELIGAAMDGECDEAELHALDAHLSECEECRAYAEALRELSELMQSDLPEPGEDFTAAAMNSIRKAAAKPGKGKLLHINRRYLTLAASLLVVVGLGMLAKRTITPKGAAAVQSEAASLDMAETPMMMYAAAAPECREEEAAAEEYAEPAEAAPENGMMLFAAAPPAPVQKSAAAAAGSTADMGADACANEAAPVNFLPELAADGWLHENMADAEGYLRRKSEWTETPADYEPVAEAAAPADCCAVVYDAPDGGTLMLLLDESGTVFGLVRGASEPDRCANN